MKRAALAWYYLRAHLTKLMGAVGIVVGYALQTQAQWVAWLSKEHRGTATAFLGIAVFVLGLYNQFSPCPTKPPE